MKKVGTFEKKEVSELNNELFVAAKTIMESATSDGTHCAHIGWSGVGSFIDYLEKTYEIKRR